jgi:hypothetical protein
MASKDFYEQMNQAIEGLQRAAEESGEAQVQRFSTQGWQPIMRDGKRVGRVRIVMAEMTVTPAKKQRKPKAKKS